MCFSTFTLSFRVFFSFFITETKPAPSLPLFDLSLSLSFVSLSSPNPSPDLSRCCRVLQSSRRRMSRDNRCRDSVPIWSEQISNDRRFAIPIRHSSRLREAIFHAASIAMLLATARTKLRRASSLASVMNQLRRRWAALWIDIREEDFTEKSQSWFLVILSVSPSWTSPGSCVVDFHFFFFFFCGGWDLVVW